VPARSADERRAQFRGHVHLRIVQGIAGESGGDQVNHCAKCQRPLRLPSHDGLGPVCRRKRAAAIPAHDLFGYDPDLAQSAALAVVREVIEESARKARMAIRRGYLVALERAGL
jgi:hypothetical protein